MANRKKKKKPLPEVVCPYCGEPAQLVPSKKIYPHARQDYGMFWACGPCDAYVGTHKNSNNHAPFGPLANKELRDFRQQAHKVFDPIWQWRVNQGADKHKARPDAYKWLAAEMEMPPHQCHIGMFNVDQCRRAIEICTPKAASIEAADQQKTYANFKVG